MIIINQVVNRSGVRCGIRWSTTLQEITRLQYHARTIQV